MSANKNTSKKSQNFGNRGFILLDKFFFLVSVIISNGIFNGLTQSELIKINRNSL